LANKGQKIRRGQKFRLTLVDCLRSVTFGGADFRRAPTLNIRKAWPGDCVNCE